MSSIPTRFSMSYVLALEKSMNLELVTTVFQIRLEGNYRLLYIQTYWFERKFNSVDLWNNLCSEVEISFFSSDG